MYRFVYFNLLDLCHPVSLGQIKKKEEAPITLAGNRREGTVCVWDGGGRGGGRGGIEAVVWSIVFCRTRVISAVTRRPTPNRSNEANLQSPATRTTPTSQGEG